MKTTTARWVASVGYGAYLACLFALYCTWPSSPDQYELAYLGWRLHVGDVPYVDWIDVNWPGTIWLHQLAVALIGNRLDTWRIADFVWMLASLAFLADLLRRAFGREAAVWAALLYPPLYVTSGTWFAGQPDLVAAHFAIVVSWFHWRAWESGRVSWQLLTGLALAAAVLVKPTVGILAPLLPLHGLCFAGLAGLRRRVWWEHAVLLAIGLALGVAAAGCVLLAQGATPQAVWESIVVANVPGNRVTSGESAAWRTAWRFHVVVWHWMSVLGGASFAWLAARAWRRGVGVPGVWLLSLLWIAGWIGYFVQSQGFPYHLGLCFTALLGFLFAGLGLATTQIRSHPIPVVVCLALAVAGTGAKLVNTFGPSVEWAAGWRGDEAYFSRFPAGDGMTIAQALGLLPEIDRTVPPGEPLLVWGEASVLNFLSERPQPTRFYYAPQLWSVDPPENLALRWQRWLEEDLEAHRARLAVVRTSSDAEPTDLPPSIRYLQRYLERHYEQIGTVGRSLVYRLRDTR